MAEPLIGTVNVAGKLLTVDGMNYGENLRLGILLKKMAIAEAGNSWLRTKHMIETLPRDKQDVAIAECVRTEASMSLPGFEAMLMARTSPKGVALELWMRARKHHPDLTLQECEAIITDVNCLEVLSDIVRQVCPDEGDENSKS